MNKDQLIDALGERLLCMNRRNRLDAQGFDGWFAHGTGDHFEQGDTLEEALTNLLAYFNAQS